MKRIFTFLAFLGFGTAFSQDVHCLKAELYNSYSDPVQIENIPNSKNELDHTTLRPNAFQIIVLPNSYADLPQVASKKLGIDKGFRVIITNNSSDSIHFSKYESQRWAPIRQVYFKNKWTTINPDTHTIQCGNERRIKISLGPNKEAVFIGTCIEGSFVAKYRYMMYDPITQSEIYSNEFEGYFDSRIMELYKTSSR
jgi:hypothetical protein